MHSNVWRDKKLCGTNLCDQRSTRIIRINKCHAEICCFRVIVRPSVCPLRKVSGNYLTSRHKRLYLWPWSIGSQNKAISVNGNHGTSYRHKRQLLGQTVQKTGDNRHLHVVGYRQLSSLIQEKILLESSSCRQQILLFVSWLHTCRSQDGKQTNEFLGQLIDQVTCLNRMQ